MQLWFHSFHFNEETGFGDVNWFPQVTQLSNGKHLRSLLSTVWLPGSVELRSSQDPSLSVSKLGHLCSFPAWNSPTPLSLALVILGHQRCLWGPAPLGGWVKLPSCGPALPFGPPPSSTYYCALSLFCLHPGLQVQGGQELLLTQDTEQHIAL